MNARRIVPVAVIVVAASLVLLAPVRARRACAQTADTPADTPDTPPTTTPGPPAPVDAGGGGGADSAPPGAASRTTVPERYRALIASVHRTPPNNTRALLADLAQLEQFGLSPGAAAVVATGRFPVAGEATFSDDWWNPRFVPYFHLHVGTDVFAARGTPVRAPVDGTFRPSNGSIGGLAACVTMADGTYFYLAHLDSLPPGLRPGQAVATGQVVGYVGNSGNAAGGPTHLHFEIHPHGLGPTNPKPYLDQFIAEARTHVPAL